MSGFKIISDSSCDLSQDLIKRHDISIIPYRVTIDGENYLKDNVELTIEEFYRAIRERGIFPKTSLPPIQDYIDVFKAGLEKGQDIICFNLTTKFSGSFQSAMNARNIILEENPEAKIFVVDSYLCTAVQGALVLEAARMREAGLSAEEVYGKCEKLKNTGKIYLTVNSLKYLQKGGRIGKVSAFAGSLLDIKPVISFDDGELIPLSKMRGRKKAIDEVIRLFKADIGKNADDYILLVLHTDEKAEAEEFKKIIEKECGNKASLDISDVGITIGAHIGPTVLGLAYIKKYEALEKSR